VLLSLKGSRDISFLFKMFLIVLVVQKAVFRVMSLNNLGNGSASFAKI
jgi:hypothetical protein